MPGTTLVLADVRTLARRSGLHPDMVRRLIVLRRELGLNVAGAAPVCDLPARIEELEARRRGAARESRWRR
jgi:hypothetical protein